MWKRSVLAGLALPCMLGITMPLQAQTDHAEKEMQILYHEPIQPTATAMGTIGEDGQPQAGLMLVFHAFEQDFKLILSSNDSLIEGLPAGQRERIARGMQLYRGRIDGVSGSWVRLSKQDGQWSGMIWDGSEMYVIDLPEHISNALQGKEAVNDSQPVIYRLSDTLREQAGDHVLYPPNSGNSGDNKMLQLPEPQDENDYRNLTEHLRSLAGGQKAGATQQLNLALVSDAQFAQSSSNPEAQLLSQANVVDGIFSEQVGVHINVTELRALNDNGPMTSTDAGTLIDQFGSYARSTLTNPGLAHLVSGRDLNGGVVGIAYLGVLCNSRYGIGLSQSAGLGATAALVMAHEIGHNFGAPHDNQGGTACSSTSADFLMNPYITGVDQFSQCSLDRIRPYVNSASCLTPVVSSESDLSIQLPVSQINTEVGHPFDFSASVNNIGAAAAPNVQLGIDLPQAVSIQQLPADCSQSGTIVSCSAGDLAAGGGKTFTLSLQGQQAGQFSASLSVAATNDANASNNSAQASFSFSQPVTEADISVSTTPDSVSAGAGATFQYQAAIHNAGPAAAQNVSAVIAVPAGISIVSAGSDSGSCVRETTQASCQLGDIPASSSRTVSVALNAQQAGQFTSQITVAAANDGSSANNTDQIALSIDAAPTPDPTPDPTPAPADPFGNGSFEQFQTQRQFGRWQQVRLANWKMLDSRSIRESDKQSGIDVNALTSEIDAELWGPGIGLTATSGDYKVELDGGRNSRDALLQTFTVEAGVDYVMSFDAYGRRTGSSDIEIWFEGRYVETLQPAGNWRNYQYSFTGTGQQQSIMLREVPTQSDGRGAVLDNFRVDAGNDGGVRSNDDDGIDNLSNLRLTVGHSGQCLSIRAGSQEEGTRVVQQTCEDKAYQQWAAVPSADGSSFQIRTTHSNQCLDVAEGSQEAGARIIQWSCHGGANQLWRVQQRGNQVMIISVNSDQCLDVANGSTRNGAPVIQWPCHGGPNQLWTPAADPAGAGIPKNFISGVIK